MNTVILILGALSLSSNDPAQNAFTQEHRKPVVAPEGNVELRRLHEHLQQIAGVEQAEPRPMLGVQLSSVQGAVAAQLPEYVQPALILTRIYEGSPAERAGLVVHDVVSAIDGDGNATLERLRETLASRKPGESVALEVYRRGQRQLVNVAVENFSPPVHAAVHPGEGGIPEVGFWATYGGEHPWPRFGVSPDGEIMVQHAENGAWEDTDADVENHNALNYWLHSGNEVIDLTTPHVDPGGTLRRQIDHLRSFYAQAPGELHFEHQSGNLEQRILELESKLEEMNRTLEKLLELAQR